MASSDGWPRHLRIHMTAVAKAMRAADTPSLDALDEAEIAEQARAARDRYYNDRLDDTDHPDLPFVFAAMADYAKLTPGGVGKRSLRAVAHRALDAEGGADDATPAELVDKAIHAGILQELPGKADRYDCPIPSMRDWLVERAGRGYEPPERTPPSRTRNREGFGR